MSGWGIWTWLLAAVLGVWGPVAHVSAVGPATPPAPPSAPPAATVPAPPQVVPGGPAREGFVPDADGTLVRVSINHGYDAARLTLSTSGRVVLVRDTSVDATRDDFVTWVVSDAALDRALRSLRRLGILEATPGSLGQGQVTPSTRTVGFFLDQGHVISSSEDSPRFPPIWRAATRLADPASYGGGLVSGPGPWVPREVGLLLHRPDAANPYPRATWPFARTIEQMAHPAPAGSIGDLAVCLRGAAAARLFASLPRGVVGVYRWSDGTATWSGRVDVTTPGYRLYGSGCEVG